MTTKTNLKIGALTQNHNETATGLRVKSEVKAGGLLTNHSETLATPSAGDDRGSAIEDMEIDAVADALRVRTGILAGFQPCI